MHEARDFFDNPLALPLSRRWLEVALGQRGAWVPVPAPLTARGWLAVARYDSGELVAMAELVDCRAESHPQFDGDRPVWRVLLCDSWPLVEALPGVAGERGVLVPVLTGSRAALARAWMTWGRRSVALDSSPVATRRDPAPALVDSAGTVVPDRPAGPGEPAAAPRPPSPVLRVDAAAVPAPPSVRGRWQQWRDDLAYPAGYRRRVRRRYGEAAQGTD